MQLEAETALIGLFWFIGPKRQFIGFSAPFTSVQTIAGFKTLDCGHVDVWRYFQFREPALRPFAYEYFPRGRVNWSEDRGFILLMDSILLKEKRDQDVITFWKLPRENTTVMSDSHYRHHSLTTEISSII